ncbi:MAG: YbjN domain-containing protein [Oscillospiraceae bacterium]|nr:YbjN domain-containing protein [Oscillospiraceae bacterium]
MEERVYSDDIADAITSFLNDDDWNFGFDDEKGVFKFSLSLKNKMKKIDYVISVREEEYSVYAVSPIGADEDDERMMQNMSEFVCRANYGLRMGNFELDHRDGEIRYKVNICCDDMIPTRGMIARSIYCPATMFERYGPGIINVIFNDVEAKDAIEACENYDD